MIVVSWHGQSNLGYVYGWRQRECAILASTHPDGRIAAALARAFGFLTIDGSGMSERQTHGTGGAGAFRAMLKAIRAGRTLFLTADVPPVPGRNISPGVIAIARRSGRPVYAMATASSRRRILERVWDKMQFNLPFSRTSWVFEEALWMTDPSISDAAYTDMLRERLDRALARAIAVAAGGKAEGRRSPLSTASPTHRVTPARAGVHPAASTRRWQVPRRSRLDTGLRRHNVVGPEAWTPARAA